MESIISVMIMGRSDDNKQLKQLQCGDGCGGDGVPVVGIRKGKVMTE